MRRCIYGLCSKSMRILMPSLTRRACQVIGCQVTGRTCGFDTTRSNAMEIKRSGSQPSGKGPADWFTGAVRIDPLFQAPNPARVGGASVTFEPGARTAWHTHPLGQTLIVT